MRHTLRALFAATAIMGAVTTAQAQEDVNIIVVSHGQASDPFWSVVKNGVSQAAEDMGVTVDYRAPETFDMVAMGQLIDAAVNQSPDGLVVSIPDADALGPSIEKAVAAGIPVISMNSGSDVSKDLGTLLHVGQDEYDAGKAGGEKLKEMGGDKGLCVNHEVGNVSLDLRCKGFAEGFGGELTVLPASNDPAEILSKVKAALASDPEIDTIMTLSASLAGEPTVTAVSESGMEGEVNIASFDLSANFLQAVADGNAAFAIDQQQYLQGYLPVTFLALNAKYGLVPGGNVPSGPNLVTKEKAAQVIDLSSKGIR
ncbi:simple sugar transport system substrate-binding protein [Mesorhizobium sp. J18]|uniref:sugar ABC transporter substrate-binding protein n=1 Tax=Mesorhizobium sp. J18 TaxID=935263 RepID=UPI0011992F3B|nr:sugar ABC transporter substrate-binding protein [Mesorhizobium sp. J18]TWG98259.1 simple sugar transport system substrate-binding protein [Mesorhizobium sp. J18]